MPFFESFLIMQPTFEMSSVDLITDRNSLRKLLDWSEGKVKDSWRIEVDIIGETKIFTRWEANPTQMLTGQSSGFGHEFEKMFTDQNEELKQSSGHHRIVKYSLGGLNLLVRFEVDAFLPSPVENISIRLENLTIQHSTPSAPTRPGHVKVLRSGQLIDSSTLLEVKTRSKGTGNNLGQVMPQLYFSQTPHVYTAYHSNGLIASEDKIAKLTISTDDFHKWESQKQASLQKLVGLIHRVRDVVTGAKGEKFLVVCEKGEGKKGVQILERVGKDIGLPNGVRERYWPGKEDSEEGGVRV